MIFNLWRFIQLLLPYGFILWLYRQNKALPTNIRTREGNNYKAILITQNYGLLFSEDKYIQNRGSYLMERKRLIENQNNEILNELNDLNFLERQRVYVEDKELKNQQSVKDNNGTI